MPATQGFGPDSLYCVYCHAEASGPCATCQALICADCARVTGGTVKRVAVCYKCEERGHGVVSWEAWWPLLRTVLWVVGGLGALALLVWASRLFL